MTRTLIPAAAMAAAVAIVTAGCGAAGASPGAVNGAATVVPANAVAFVAASTDLSSSQWHSVGNVLLQGLQKQGKLSWTNDIRPALGDELDLAVLPGKHVVALTQPRDASKLSSLAAKYKLVTRRFGDWTAVAKQQDTLSALAGPSTTLAQSSAFNEAMSRLPSDALVRAYVNAAAAQKLLTSLPGQTETVSTPIRHAFGRGTLAQATAATRFLWLAADVRSVAAGLKLEAFARTAAPTAAALQAAQYLRFPTPSYTPQLLDEIPAGALAVADFLVQPSSFELLPALPAPLVHLFGGSNGSVVLGQLDGLLGGETAVYVRPGLPMPEVTLVTQPQDTTVAATALASLQSEVQVPMLKNVQLYHASIGGQFVVSTTQKGIDDLRGGGAKLATDANFVEAKNDSGMPAETTGFLYADVKDALPLLTLAGANLPAGLPHLGTFMAYGSRDQSEVRFSVFLGVSSS
jgi:hypothetical protein